MAGGRPSPALRLRRPFAWAILVIADAEEADLPESFEHGPVVAFETGIVVAVRHAQDVEFDALGAEVVPPFLVDVVCFVDADPERGDALLCDHVVQVSSGRPALGDPDEEQVLVMPPGAWRIRAAGSPRDQPEEVEVWVSKP